MGLTGKILTAAEQGWITNLYITHGLFCDCGEPVEHLLRCVRTHIEEDDGFEDELLTFAMDAPFEDGDVRVIEDGAEG
ncbi:ORF2 [torque teno Delphinidae virus 48]